MISNETATSLDERMKVAGMIPLSEMLKGGQPLDKWMANTGVCDLDTFEQWLRMRYGEFMRMRVAYELGDKDKSDDLYEWVFAHASALGEVVVNFTAMQDRIARTPADGPEPAAGELRFVFEDFPGPDNRCVFVEVEDADGKSVNAGDWRRRPDGLVELRITHPAPSDGPPDAVSEAEVEAAAQAMLVSFQNRISAMAKMPYTETKVTTPNIEVYRAYAVAALEAAQRARK